MDELFTEKIVKGISEHVLYPHANKLSSETLWQSGHWRFDLLQFVLIQFFHTTSPNVYFPASLAEQLTNSHNNDERENILGQCFSYLGLISPDDTSIVSGKCSLQENYKFMNQLLDLAKINQASVRGFQNSVYSSFPEFMNTSLEKDTRLINGIASQQSLVFGTPVRLFSQDILSRLANEPMPSMSYLEDVVQSTEQQTRNLAEQIYQIEQRLNERKNQINPLDSTDLVRELSSQFVTIEQIAAEMHSELNGLEFLMKKFNDIYTTDFATWTQKELQKSTNSAEQREQQTAQILGESTRRVLANFKQLKQLLSNLHSVQQSYLQILSEDDQQHSHFQQLFHMMRNNQFSQDRVNQLVEYSKILQESSRRVFQ